jgi:hypothetical protein
MKIENRMVTAGKVLKVVRKLAKESAKEITLDLGAYQNGREQGYSLFYIDAKNHVFVCWAEARSSDKIVVYVGDFVPMQSITEKMYRNARFFRYDEIEKAARFIISQFN